MMRSLLWLLAVFAAAVALAVAGRVGEGIVVVAYPPWRVEVSSINDMAAGKPPLVWRNKA